VHFTLFGDAETSKQDAAELDGRYAAVDTTVPSGVTSVKSTVTLPCVSVLPPLFSTVSL
jgi:hypothetical protein